MKRLSALAALFMVIATVFVGTSSSPAVAGSWNYGSESKTLTVTRDMQDTGYFCGPASVKAALSARGVSRTQSWLAGQLGTTENGTNSAYDTTRVLNNVLGTGWYETKIIPGDYATAYEIGVLKTDIRLDIYNGYVIVANVIGTAYDTNGNPHSYKYGHYLTVVGYSSYGDVARIYDVANDTFYNMSTVKLAHWIASRGYSA